MVLTDRLFCDITYLNRVAVLLVTLGAGPSKFPANPVHRGQGAALYFLLPYEYGICSRRELLPYQKQPYNSALNIFFLLPSLAIYSPQPLYGLFKFIIYLAVFKGVAANSRYLTFSLWSCYSVARRNIRRYSRGLHYRRWTHTGYITIKRRQRSNGTH